MALDLAIAHSLAAALIKRLEACRLTGYPDSTGVPTNGYGHTGPEVKIGVAITQEIADHNLDVDLAQAGERLGTAIFGHTAQLDNHEYAALLSFVFNVGSQPGWTIWKDINAGNLTDVPHQLSRFVNAGGHVLQGLVNRRNAEIAYWNTADLEQAVAVQQPALTPGNLAPPSSFTRAVDTPPTPAPAPPLNTQSLITKGVVLVSGLATAAGSVGTQIHDAVAPYASTAPIFQTIVTVASGLVVAAAIVGILIHADQTHARTQ